jgi:hypothetical protein
MYVESRPYAATEPLPLAAAHAAPTHRQLLATAAEELPYDRGLYVGHVGRGAPKPQPAATVVIKNS